MSRRKQADALTIQRVRGDHPDSVRRGGLSTETGGVSSGGRGEVGSTEWRIIASHPDSTLPVTLYITPYARLALQEWESTTRVVMDKGDNPLYNFCLQVRDEGEWMRVARAP